MSRYSHHYPPSYIKKIVTCNSLWPLPQGYHIKRKSENRRGAHSRHRIATRIPGRDTRITQPRQSGQSRWRSLRLPQRRGTFLLTPNANFQRCLTCGPSNCHYQRRRFFLWHTFPTQLLSDGTPVGGPIRKCVHITPIPYTATNVPRSSARSGRCLARYALSASMLRSVCCWRLRPYLCATPCSVTKAVG